MSHDEPIVPLIELESGADVRVRAALTAARDELPSVERLEAIFARLPIGGPDGPGDGPAGDGSGAGPAAAGSAGAAASAVGTVGAGAMLTKAAALAVVMVAGATTYFATRGGDSGAPMARTTHDQPSASATAAESVGTRAAPATAPTIAPILSAELEAPAIFPERSVAAPSAPLGSAPTPVVRAEIEILRDAQAARAADPARALVLVGEHSRAYPNGLLSQEREMLRIEATLALGRRAEATALAQRFRARYPGSAYARRLDDTFGSP